MKKPRWVLRATVLALHERLLSEFGGGTGIRDDGMLNSALAAGEIDEPRYAAWLAQNCET